MFESYLKPPISFPSVSGSVCNFNSQYAGLPLKSHKIALTSTQSGSGTPSPFNPRALNGWSAINIGNSNAYDTNIEQGTLNNSGLNGNATNRIRTADYIPVVSGHTYKITLKGSGTFYFGVSGYTANDYTTARTQSTAWLGNNSDLLIDAGVKYIRINVRFMDSTDITPADLTGILVTDITNYSTIQIGSTIYGGNYDAVSGVLPVTHGIVTYDSNNVPFMQIGTISGGVKIRVFIRQSGISQTVSGVPDMLCNIAEPVEVNAQYQGNEGISIRVNANVNNQGFYIYNEDIQTLEDWQDYVNNNSITVAYPLATPQTIQLPPCPIDTLVGVNNIWADTGNTTLQYIKLG